MVPPKAWVYSIGKVLQRCFAKATQSERGYDLDRFIKYIRTYDAMLAKLSGPQPVVKQSRESHLDWMTQLDHPRFVLSRQARADVEKYVLCEPFGLAFGFQSSRWGSCLAQVSVVACVAGCVLKK